MATAPNSFLNTKISSLEEINHTLQSEFNKLKDEMEALKSRGTATKKRDRPPERINIPKDDLILSYKTTVFSLAL